MCIWNGNEDVPSKSASPATDVVPGVQRCWRPCHSLTVSAYAGPSVLPKTS